MRIFILIILVAVMAEEVTVMWRPISPAPAWMAGAVVGPYVVWVGAAFGACALGRRRLALRARPTGQVLHRAGRFLQGCRLAILGTFLFQLYGLGLLVWLRGWVGTWPMGAEVAAILLPLGSSVLLWRASWSLDHEVRCREAGAAVGGRGPWVCVLFQVRHQMLIVLVPMLVVLTWVRLLDLWIKPGAPLEPWLEPLMAAGALGMFILAPLLILVIWDAVPLPAGDLRTGLESICAECGVRVRKFMLWRTGSEVANAAVMGVVGRLRYIIFSDLLLERLSPRQIQAVLAHEIGHVRCHHLPWMACCVLAILCGVTQLMQMAHWALKEWMGISPESVWPPLARTVPVFSLLILVGAWSWLFGCVSRRFERQADTFAVRYMAGATSAIPGQGVLIGPEAVEATAGALLHVATLHGIDLKQRSWLHGSMAWRVEYLRSLVGIDSRRCSIDAQVRWICWSSVAVLAAAAAWEIMARSF